MAQGFSDVVRLGAGWVELLDAVGDIVCLCDQSGALTFVNRAWCEFTGFAREAAASGWEAALHPGDLESFRSYLTERWLGRGSPNVEVRLRREDGVYRRMRASLTAVGDRGRSAGSVVVTLSEVESVADSRLRRLFEANVVGILISNNAGAIIEANDAFLAMIGYSRQDLEAGRVDWRALTPPEWLPLDERAIVEMAEHGVFAQYEKEYLRKDGTRLPISVGGARIAGTSDEQICYIVDLSDIRRAQAALLRSESRFDRLAAANVIGIITMRVSDGKIVEANDEFLRIVGYGREDLDSGALGWAELTPPEWLGAGEREGDELRTVGRIATFEKEYVRKDGARVPVLVGGALVAGSTDEIVCYVLDLSEQRDATLQLRESEQRYRILAEALPLIVMLSDEHRRLIYVNQHYEAYTGIGSAEIPERWSDAIHPDDIETIRRARATGDAYEVEYRLRRASDGAYRWHYARALEIPQGLPGARWLATAMDIDDRKRAEESLRFIERAGSLLSKSLDLHATFETLLDLVVPEFGDWASISLLNERGAIETIFARHSDPSKAQLVRSICGVSYLADSHDWGTAAALRTGLPQLVAEISYDDVKGAVKEPYVGVLQELGFGSLVALPIFSDGTVIGAFGIVSTGGRRRYSQADLPPLEELARRAGFAIGNAREYQRERRVASMLQEAALPRKLPTVSGFRFDGYYRAGRREAAIGGDWFDALVVAGGRIVISLGDVAGSGLDAAVLMSKVRQVMRGAAHVDADPMTMLEVADRTLRSEHEHGMVTAFVGVIDPLAKTMHYASAGHLPGLLRNADGSLVELTAPGLPLGYRDMARSERRAAMLPPGSHLVLYTDGLVEWSRDIAQGEALLRARLLETDVLDAAQPAKALVDAVLPATGALDDIAVLIVSIEG